MKFNMISIVHDVCDLVLTAYSRTSCISATYVSIAAQDIRKSLAYCMNCHWNVNIVKILAITL